MIAVANQRWRDGYHSFRPPDEPIRTRDYDVVPIASDSVAKEFVLRHHYSGSYPAARFRYGLYRGDALEGVAVFSVPCNNAVITSVFPGNPLDGVELGRFVLLDKVAGNAETWCLARCFEYLRQEGIRGVVSFSDPVPRQRADGTVVFKGHIGYIYQAHNAKYLGRGTKRRLRILPDGRVFSDRAIQKIRAGERGWRYASEILERQGATACPEHDRRAWLEEWLPKLTRVTAHGGNHKYAWGLKRRCADHLESLPYPKQLDYISMAGAGAAAFRLSPSRSTSLPST